MLKLQDASMLAAAGGRLSSFTWRLIIGVVFALAASLALDSYVIGFGWLAALIGAMCVDAWLGKQYRSAATAEQRELLGALFMLACATTICVFAGMALFLLFHGGGPGRELCLLMAGSSLVSVMLFLFQAPIFMLITATPCALCMAAAPLAPFEAGPASPLAGALAVALGVGAFLAYVARAALNSERLFVGLQRANAEAETRRAEADAKRIEAEIANRAKSEFLTTMTHELRTPLNAVIGYAEIIEEDLIADERKQLAQDAGKIVGSARHLLGLIDQILKFSHSEVAAQNSKRVEIDLRALIAAASDSIAPMAAQKNIRISTQLAPSLSRVVADEAALRGVLGELAKNAVKFTQAGRIAIAADRENRQGGDWLRISVSDTGVGMCPAQLAKAFKPFTQLDGSTTRAEGGIGLGLTIAQRTVQLLGGELVCVSEPGTGSTFTVRLPLGAEAAAEAAVIGAAA